MLERKSIVDQIEITRECCLQIRLALLIVDGDQEISSKWHRTSIPADAPANAAGVQMEAVNTHLDSMGEAPVGQPCLDKIAAAYALCQSFAQPKSE